MGCKIVVVTHVIFFPSSLTLCAVAPPAWLGIGSTFSLSAKPRFLNSSGAMRLLRSEDVSAKELRGYVSR